jgi:hypothetical protein
MTSIYNNPLASLYGSSLYNSKLGALDYHLTDRYGTYGNSDSLYDTTSFDTDLSSLYGGYGKNTSKARLARENAILRAELEEYKDAAENRTGLFGGPVLGADEKGNGGLDVFSGVGGFLLSKLLGGGKDGGGGLFGGLFGG